MVPDITKSLAHKIRTVENSASSWNKSGVWERVQEEVQGGKRVSHWYAIAATILLLAGFVSFRMFYSQPVAGPTEVLSQSTEKADLKDDEKAGMAEGSIPAVRPLSVRAKENDQTVKKAPAKKSMQPAGEADVAPLEELQVEFEIVLEPDAVIQTIDAMESLATDNRIKPVVGVVIPNKSEVALTPPKKRKKLLRLEPADPLPWEQDLNNTLVLARRK